MGKYEENHYRKKEKRKKLDISSGILFVVTPSSCFREPTVRQALINF